MIKCTFCGYQFEESEARPGCSGCPMSRSCNKTKCPNCSYEIPREPALIKLIKRKWGKKHV